MKTFIDLGVFTGDTVSIVLEKYPDLDQIHAFEPDPQNYAELQAKHGGGKRVSIYNAAATAEVGEANLYQGVEYGKLGGSLLESKSNIDTSSSTTVQCMDFSEFLREHFSPEDHVILKIDIEGGEYELLEKLLENGAISLVTELYVEWHWEIIDYPEEKHEDLVRRLRALGYPITGSKQLDEFILVAEFSPWRMKLQRWNYLFRKWVRNSKLGPIIRKILNK